MMLRTLLAIAMLGCASRPPQDTPGIATTFDPEAPQFGPGLGSTHVVRDTTPPPPDTFTPAPFAEQRRDADDLIAKVHMLCKHPRDHARLVTALRSLADALFVAAGTPENVAAIAEHRRVMLAEIDVFARTPPDSPAQANRIRVILDRAMLAITGGTARTKKDVPLFNVASAQLAESVRHIDPTEPPSEQRADVLASMQRAANALYAALGLNAPFRMTRPTVTG